MSEYKQSNNKLTASGTGAGAKAQPISNDAIDDKLSKLQGLLKMAKN